MPQEISQEEIIRIVQDRIKALDATGGVSDFGKVMKSLMGELKGKVDGKRVSQIVKEQLSQKPHEEKK